MKWIPCSETLPDKEGSYLVTVEIGKTKRRLVQKASLRVFDNGNKKWLRVGQNNSVIAWMDLPDVYEGE